MFKTKFDIGMQKRDDGTFKRQMEGINSVDVTELFSEGGDYARSKTVEFFAITDLAVSARSGTPKSEFYVCLSVDTWYLKIQVNSRISLLPLLSFTITVYTSTTSKNHVSCLPDLAETAKFFIAKN